MTTSRGFALAAAAAASILLAGCAPAAAPAPATPEPTRVQAAVGAVLATATFPAGEEVQGSVEIVVGDSGSWIVRYHDMTFGDALSEDPWLLAYGPIQPDGCPTQTTWRVNLGTDSAHDGDEFVVPEPFLHDPSFDDPTYADSLGIRLPGAACGGIRYAVAPLVWKVAPLHPDFDGVDSGSRTGATGTTADGVYTVAEGDTTEGIEARFGLSADQLDYLNPISQRPAANPWAQFPKPGCTVNVAFDARWHFIRCAV